MDRRALGRGGGWCIVGGGLFGSETAEVLLALGPETTDDDRILAVRVLADLVPMVDSRCQTKWLPRLLRLVKSVEPSRRPMDRLPDRLEPLLDRFPGARQEFDEIVQQTRDACQVKRAAPERAR